MIAPSRKETEFTSIPGAILPPVPQPLLPNLGRGGVGAYQMDYQILVLFNSQERTVGEFQRLGEETGWKLVPQLYIILAHVRYPEQNILSIAG